MEALGYIAAFFSLIGFLPQTIKTIRTKQTRDLSLTSFGLIVVSTSLWCLYGLSIGSPAIWFTNGFIAVCSTMIVVIKIRNDQSFRHN